MVHRHSHGFQETPWCASSTSWESYGADPVSELDLNLCLANRWPEGSASGRPLAEQTGERGQVYVFSEPSDGTGLVYIEPPRFSLCASPRAPCLHTTANPWTSDHLANVTPWESRPGDFDRDIDLHLYLTDEGPAGVAGGRLWSERTGEYGQVYAFSEPSGGTGLVYSEPPYFSLDAWPIAGKPLRSERTGEYGQVYAFSDPSGKTGLVYFEPPYFSMDAWLRTPLLAEDEQPVHK